MKWIKVSDELPEIYDVSYSVLIYRLHSPLFSAGHEIAVWQNGKFYSCNVATQYQEYEIDECCVTHWMYLPEAP